MKSKTTKLKLKKEVIARLSTMNTVKGGTFADTYVECEGTPYYTMKNCRQTFFNHCNTQSLVFDCDPLSQGCPGPVSDGCNPTGGRETHICITGNCATHDCVIMTVEDGCQVNPIG